MKKADYEKKITDLNELYRSKMIDGKIYLKQILPIISDYEKCEDITIKDRVKLKALKGLLKTIQVLL